jgi:hypothetical protein
VEEARHLYRRAHTTLSSYSDCRLPQKPRQSGRVPKIITRNTIAKSLIENIRSLGIVCSDSEFGQISSSSAWHSNAFAATQTSSWISHLKERNHYLHSQNRLDDISMVQKYLNTIFLGVKEQKLPSETAINTHGIAGSAVT